MRQPPVLICALFAFAASLVAQTPPAPAARTLVLTHANVVDVAAGSVRRDADVTIRDGRIASVAPSGKSAAAADVRTIDATGKFLIPGLVDMHIHWYDQRYLGLFIANGVTTVRQMWGFPMHLAWRKQIDAGALLGPRFVISSPIVDGPNPVWPNSVVAADAAAGKAVVEQMKRDGYDFVKVYSRLPRDAYFAIAKTSKDLGIPFAGHVPSQVSALEASDAGQRSIEHNTGILVASSSAESQLREDGIRLLSGGEAGRGIPPERRQAIRNLNEQLLSTFDAAKAAALFARFVKNDTWMCPTLTVLRSMASLDDAAFTSDPRLEYMPKQMRDSWNPANDPRNATKTAADYAVERRVYRKQLEIVGAMNRAGVKIIAGTDVLNPFVFPGFSLHDELALLVEAGLTPAQALRAATLAPAQYLGAEKVSGTIEPGKNADLVLLEGNPLDDIGNTKRIAAVVTRGRLLDRGELDTLLAQARKL
jgi:imidazolonepropionase-like amidohydrolase